MICSGAAPTAKLKPPLPLLLRPDLNRSQIHFTVEAIPNGALELKLGIRYGLAAVKNVGGAASFKLDLTSPASPTISNAASSEMRCWPTGF